MKTLLALSPLTVLAILMAPPPANLDLQYPIVEGYGGIVPLPDSAHQPRPDARVVLDISSDKLEGDVLKGIDRAARFINLHASATQSAGGKLGIALVFHGPATRATLQDAAYDRHMEGEGQPAGGAGNPNLALLRKLRAAGAEVFVCGQALARQGYRTEEVAEEVTVALSAATALINLQQGGYAYIPFH